ncbi:MAG: hypothetical protein KL839_03990 [Rhizobium sp.]|nr:hypothetical protein [Rhizobium sp.]
MKKHLNANCIFCDDIREEATGKLILIGVYSGQIVVPGPLEKGGLTVSQFIQIRGLSQGSHSFSLRMERYTDGALDGTSEIEGEFEVEDEDVDATVVAGNLKVHLKAESLLKAILTVEGYESQEIGSFRIVFDSEIASPDFD